MIKEIYKEAALKQKKLLLTESSGRTRTIEPYLIYRSKEGQELYNFFQTDGYSSSGGLPQWRQLPTSKISSLEILDETFNIQSDYDSSSEKYYQVTFSI